MAGDWIKWTHGLPDKPEVIRLSGLLNLPREVVVCRLMRFWEWCDENVPDTDIRTTGSAFVKMSPRRGDNVAFVDALVCTPNFADSLAVVGWIKFRDDLIELPNFGRHNGETAKTRARNAKNQKRKRKSDDTSDLTPSPNDGDSCHRPSQQMSPSRGDIAVTRGEESISLNPKTPPPPAKPGGDGGGNFRTLPADDSQVDPGRPETARPRRLSHDRQPDPSAIAVAEDIASHAILERFPPFAEFVREWVRAGLKGHDAPGGIRETGTRRGWWQDRMRDPWWAGNWLEGVRRLSKSQKAKGLEKGFGGVTIDVFLRDADTLVKVLEGTYDDPGTKPASGKSLADEVAATKRRLQAQS